MGITIMRILGVALGAAAIGLVCCPLPAASPERCRDGSERLPGSRLCPAVARQALIYGGAKRPLPEGCSWAINEAPFRDGAYLFYLAARCGDKLSKLSVAGGPLPAGLRIASSALPGAAPGEDFGTVFPAEEAAADAIVGLAAAGMTPAELKICRAREVALDGGLGSDAYTVDYKDEYLNAPPGGRLPARRCGRYGADDEGLAFWRVFGGYAWFFDMGGSEDWDVDPSTITLVSAEGLKRAPPDVAAKGE